MALSASAVQIVSREAISRNDEIADRPDGNRTGISSGAWLAPFLTSVPIQEPFVDAERAASFLSMRRKTLLELARRGKLPGHPVGAGQRRMWKFRISELDHWMSQAVNSSQRPGLGSRRIS